MFSLSNGRQLSADALGGAGRASIEAHPTRPDVLGLRNQSEASWQAMLPSGEHHTIEPGKTVRLLPGLQINFGSEKGFVCAARDGSLP